MALHRESERRRRDQTCPSPPQASGTAVVRKDSASEPCRRSVDSEGDFPLALPTVAHDSL